MLALLDLLVLSCQAIKNSWHFANSDKDNDAAVDVDADVAAYKLSNVRLPKIMLSSCSHR